MPELPEVQTVLDTLKLQIQDLEIKDIKVLYKSIIDSPTLTFKRQLKGQHFRGFKRRGKYLLFEMDDVTFVSHLRMEGKYFIKKHNEPIDKHTHVIFCLDNGYDLRYNDVRKFGRMELIDKKDNYDDFKNLGPEPFSNKFNKEYVENYLSKSIKPIKEVLLDQNFVSGLGNIYADEVLFDIGVMPTRKANQLSLEEIDKLILSIRKILKKAIKAGGTTIRSYTSSLGVTGRFQLKLNVHTKKICPKCGNDIKKIRVGGRGTYYCLMCQK